MIDVAQVVDRFISICFAGPNGKQPDLSSAFELSLPIVSVLSSEWRGHSRHSHFGTLSHSEQFLLAIKPNKGDPSKLVIRLAPPFIPKQTQVESMDISDGRFQQNIRHLQRSRRPATTSARMINNYHNIHSTADNMAT